MKSLKKYNVVKKAMLVMSALFVLVFSSCEDVVTLDLDEPDAKIVIDAEIIWKKGTSGNEQVIKITKVAPYYNTSTTKVSGAAVRVENSNGDVFTFNETDPGSYVCTDFVPALNMDYKLFVEAEGQSFTASEKLTTVTPIDRIEQNLISDFGGEEVIELTYYFKDPADEENFYLGDYRSDFLLFPEYDLTDDFFYNGNEINRKFSDEDMKPGNVVTITHRGISKNFYNYMKLILEASSSNPFAVPPGNIRGNIINVNDTGNFALGYFRLCEAESLIYNVK